MTYTTRVGQSFAGSDQDYETYANLTWTYTNGDWRGECVAQRHDDMDGDNVYVVEERRVTYSSSNPPHWPLMNTRNPPAVGEEVNSWTSDACALEMETWTYAGLSNGVHRAESTDADRPYHFVTTWDADSGLVLTWHHSKEGSSAPRSNVGRLVATDAP